MSLRCCAVVARVIRRLVVLGDVAVIVVITMVVMVVAHGMLVTEAIDVTGIGYVVAGDSGDAGDCGGGVGVGASSARATGAD